MADDSWNNNKLSKGQVIQRLTALDCKEIKIFSEDAAKWIAPTGETFFISYEYCDANYLERLVAQLDKWTKFHSE